MRIVRTATSYFLLVFAAGFALGVVRRLLLVPRLGDRTAELLEMPVMLAVLVAASRRHERRTPDLSPPQQLAVGGLALLWMLAAECALGCLIAGKSPWQVLGERDPVAGTVYYVMLVTFALLPWLWAERRDVHRDPS